MIHHIYNYFCTIVNDQHMIDTLSWEKCRTMPDLLTPLTHSVLQIKAALTVSSGKSWARPNETITQTPLHCFTSKHKRPVINIMKQHYVSDLPSEITTMYLPTLQKWDITNNHAFINTIKPTNYSSHKRHPICTPTLQALSFKHRYSSNVASCEWCGPVT